MIIARTAPHFYPMVTGPAKQAYRISVEMERFGYSSVIYTTTPEEPGPSVVDLSKVRVKRLPVSVRAMQFDVAPSFPGVLARDSFDLLHSHEYRDYLGIVAFGAAKIARKPYILQPHGALSGYAHTLPRSSWGPYKFYDAATRKAIVRRADRVVVATTDELREALSFGARQQSCKLIPPPIQVSEIARKPVGTPLRLLFVGRISPSRNVSDIVKALAMCKNAAPAHLFVVGGEERLSALEKPGFYAELINLANSLGVGDRVTFTGPLYGRELEEMYEKADVFVYASSYESFGQPLLEAAAHGLPIISTPVGVAKDIVIPDKTGFLFEVGDRANLSEHLKEIANDPSKIEEMSVRLNSLVRAKYNWGSILKAYRELYEELTAN